ncbi:MAG: hemerythrin domain-containing protein [Anaeromyxobacter sp.]
MTTERFDLYTAVHKGIRAQLFEAATWAGRTDFARAGEAAAAAARVARLLAFLEEHAEKEDAVLMPELQRLAPEVHADLQGEHARVDGLHRELHGLLDRLATAGEAERVALGRRLQERLSRLTAEHLRHMDREEGEATRAFHAHRSDEELGALHGRILASIPPARMADWSAIMIPALSLPERAGMLSGMARKLPAPVFETIVAPARAALGPAAWAETAAAGGF